jgi:alpha-tubulin suppressor-like RCC1 family protein
MPFPFVLLAPHDACHRVTRRNDGRRFLATVASTAMLACNAPDGVSARGALALRVQGTPGLSDSVRILVRGADHRDTSALSGSTITIADLTPSKYTVALEGFRAGVLVQFGEMKDIDVVGGKNTPVMMLLPDFAVPASITVPRFTVQLQFSLGFDVVSGAGGYSVEWDRDSLFPNPTVVTAASSPTLVTVPAPGRYYVRVRGVDSYGARGSSSSAQQIDVVIQAKSVSAGFRHTCVVSAASQGYCWGNNEDGALGPSLGTAGSPFPIAVPEGLLINSISAGEEFTCATTTGGTGYCWGSNEWGELGRGNRISSPVPAVVNGGIAFASISAGAGHACGVEQVFRALYCWGRNTSGELGVGSTDMYRTAPDVGREVLPNVNSVSAGEFVGAFSCAEDFSVPLCWGSNSGGQLGSLSTLGASSTPVPIDLATQDFILGVTAGGAHACTWTSARVAYCWGRNVEGQVGSASTNSSFPQPTRVVGTQAFVSLTAGSGHTCGLTGEMTVYCWGANDLGQLGIGGNTLGESKPTLPVSGGLTFLSIDAGWNHTCGVTPSGAVYCWGSNEGGQLGDGTTTDRFTPTPVRAP